MQSYFGPDFFTRNRDKLREALGSDTTIVVTANGNMQRGTDETYKFYQESNFWYLTGINVADAMLVMHASETYLLIPTLNSTQQAFDGAHDLSSYLQRSGIGTILPLQEGWRRLKSELQSNPQIATLASPPPYDKRHGFYTLPYRRNLIRKLKYTQPNLTLTDIRLLLAELRALKQPEELQAIQQAIDITSETLNDVTSSELFKTAQHEYELEAAITYGFRRRGAEGHSFSPIVGAGKDSTTLHHVANAGPVGRKDMIVLDVGAEVEHYAADITRTVSRLPLSARQKAVFQAVETVQDYALSLIRPGVLAVEYEQQVEAYMGKQLQKLGLISQPGHPAIRRYYPHATSHFLGLDVHDVGNYQKPWQTGMVITCEPGIYIPEEGIGVRIEDDILITSAGYKNLSAACPRQLTSVQ